MSIFTSCDTDFDVITPWKETMIVYALLDQNEEYQYVRINKAYLGEGDALIMGQTDSIYYSTKSLEVSLYSISNGFSDTTKLIDLYPTIFPKQSGSFNSQQNVIYTVKTDSIPSFTKNNTYYLSIINKETANIVHATTDLISGFSFKGLDTIGPYVLYKSSNPDVFQEIRWFPAKYGDVDVGLVYQLDVFFNYIENGEEKSILWRQPSVIPESPLVKKTQLYGSNFFNFIQANIEKDATKIREFSSLSLVMTIGTPELATYINISSPLSSISQEKIEYTNINNGLGIFSARNTSTIYSVGLNPCTLEHLVEIDRGFKLTDVQSLSPCID